MRLQKSNVNCVQRANVNTNCHFEGNNLKYVHKLYLIQIHMPQGHINRDSVCDMIWRLLNTLGLIGVGLFEEKSKANYAFFAEAHKLYTHMGDVFVGLCFRLFTRNNAQSI
jgi:hypothetical protein